MGQALRLGQARGPSAAAIGQARGPSAEARGPSATARTGQGGRALRPHGQ